jgi:neural Wiskott-Aldrich syndrome protein
MGKLVENIPRLMKVATPERVEVRLSREESSSLLANFDGRGEIKLHNVVLTRAMSVMLRAPDGGFTIENLSPETQWIVDRPSFLETEPFGRWRWLVTPLHSGAHKLLLIISARNVDENGMIGDTPLPDQVIEIKVETNIRRNAMIIGRWAGLMVAGAIVTETVLWIMRAILR